MLNLTEISIIISGGVVLAGVIGSHWRLVHKVEASRIKGEQQIQHIQDTKADKYNGLSKVNESLVRIESKLDEHHSKIETIFDKAPCFQPGWKKDKC